MARVAAILAGVWLMFAPAVLGYGDPAAANDRIFGPIGAAFAFVAIWGVLRSLRWGTMPVGVWLVVSPFVIGYGIPEATVSSVLAGAVMMATAPLGAEVSESYGGGWSALFRPEGDTD